MTDAPAAAPSAERLREVFRVFLRLGLTAFGGPAAHIAAMEDEVVRVRGWVTREEFLDLLSAANVIPGPNSTELAIHLGHQRAGWRGLLVAGVAFIAPATAMVWIIAMSYAQYGRRPEVAALLAGMQPVVLAVVLQAVWRLARAALRSAMPIAIAVCSVVAVMAGAHELLVLAGAALAGWLSLGRRDRASAAAMVLGPTGLVGAAAVSAAPSVSTVFAAFLKIGSVLFGSGYVLLAFLRSEFVERHHWLTEAQLLDAIAVGQVTPGPVFTSATFVGYLLAGHGGAAAATAGVFLRAVLFVAVSGPLVRRIRRAPAASAALDGVNAGSLALMAAVMLVMLRPVATSVTGVGIFLVASAVLLRTRIGAGWLLLAGAIVGIAQVAVHQAFPALFAGT